MSPWPQMFFIVKRRPYSQAGRRGFESHLPLHLFNHLQRFLNSAQPTFRGNEVAGIPEVVEDAKFERWICSAPRWKSQAKSGRRLDRFWPHAFIGEIWDGCASRSLMTCRQC